MIERAIAGFPMENESAPEGDADVLRGRLVGILWLRKTPRVPNHFRLSHHGRLLSPALACRNSCYHGRRNSPEELDTAPSDSIAMPASPGCTKTCPHTATWPAGELTVMPC